MPGVSEEMLIERTVLGPNNPRPLLGQAEARFEEGIWADAFPSNSATDYRVPSETGAGKLGGHVRDAPVDGDASIPFKLDYTPIYLPICLSRYPTGHSNQSNVTYVRALTCI